MGVSVQDTWFQPDTSPSAGGLLLNSVRLGVEWTNGSVDDPAPSALTRSEWLAIRAASTNGQSTFDAAMAQTSVASWYAGIASHPVPQSGPSLPWQTLVRLCVAGSTFAG